MFCKDLGTAWVALALLFTGVFGTNPCTQRSGLIAEPLLNVKLATISISVINTGSELNCVQRCFRMKACDGINAKTKSPNSVICELLSSNTGSEGEKLVSEEGWKYYDFKPKSVCKAEGGNLCSASQSCVDDRLQPEGFLCKNLPNIAYLKATSQSSTFSSASSAKAVDGNKDGNFKYLSCTHTLGNTRFPWWRVDFGKEATVHSVAITNRADCCSERLGKFDIFVGSNTANGGNGNQVCRNNLSMMVPGTMLFKCQANRVGRYLYIKSQLTDPLTLCEVEVFGVL